MNDRNDPLMERAAALPDEINPNRDLWPVIASRLTPAIQSKPSSRSSVWPIALAAGLALAVLSSAITWTVANRADVSPDRIAAVITEPARPYVQDAELVQIRQELTAALDDNLMRLSPKTRRKVSANLLEIHESLAEIRMALDADPNNGFLHQLLYTTYQQELGLLSNINRVALTLPDEIET
ncbi:MAG: hypothetical protein OER80_04540 [Gammaproteobacteria bacterium]|nr:hypothetical protein [Gammaproteobacteria bacterium]